MKFTDAFLQEIKFRNDIEEVVSRYVPLKKAGSNMTACCPFHSEKTPSFMVSSAKRIFRCFGCDVGGDVISFVMLMENLDYVSAVVKLAEWAKIPVPEDDAEYRAKAVKQKRIFEINREAALYFHNNLMDSGREESKNALDYLRGRQIKDPAIKHFGLGYSLASWDELTKHMSAKGFSKEELKTAFLCGMTKKGNYADYFRGRLMFPIIDPAGNVIAFGGRALESKTMPKYLNSSDTPAFKKSRHLYALNFAKNSVGANKKFDCFILCEGYMDVISLHQAGLACAVASLGTAVTGDQARLMAKYAKRAVLAYDTDEAGKRAMDKAAGLLGEVGLEVKVLNLGDTKDPDEFIRKYGGKKLEDQLLRPKGYTEAKLDAIFAKYDTGDADDKIKAINESCEQLALVNSELERDVYGARLAEKYKMPPETILKNIKKFAASRAKKQESDMVGGALRKIEGLGDRINPDRAKYPESVKKEEVILGILLTYPELYGNVKAILDESLFISEFGKKIYNLFAAAKGSDSGQNFDTVMITKELSLEETGRVAAMMTSENLPENDISGALENFIRALKRQNRLYEEKNVNYKEIASSGDDWIHHIRGKNEKGENKIYDGR